MLDINKLKRAIQLIRVGQPFGEYDHALYATYLYCVRSQARGKIHMPIWNKRHPRNMTFNIHNPTLWAPSPVANGRFEIRTLGDQAKWIEYTKIYIEGRQESATKYNWMCSWTNLIVDFELKDAPPIEIVATESTGDCGGPSGTSTV